MTNQMVSHLARLWDMTRPHIVLALFGTIHLLVYCYTIDQVMANYSIQISYSYLYLLRYIAPISCHLELNHTPNMTAVNCTFKKI